MKIVLCIAILALSLFAQADRLALPDVRVQVCGPVVVSQEEVGAAILAMQETKCGKNVKVESFDGYFAVYATHAVLINHAGR